MVRPRVISGFMSPVSAISSNIVFDIDTSATPRRPAHRPSRRHVVVEGAMGLFATIPVDEVTVQDIATAVEMTPAAVYYHFASKEQILIEGMHQFSEQFLDEIRSQVPRPGDPGLGDMITHVLTWTLRRRAHATVYFVNSIGLNLMVEALRREVREEMVDLLRVAVKAVRGRLSGAEAGVIAVSLVSLIETSLASILNQDSVYRGLGAKKSIDAVVAVADRVAGLSVAG
jgi:AcrR family transcriptional regulator